ncbi:LysR family transcriptional regulator [Variovorax rhizosphaerae]|uniref:LysR family transcriptional regulator n=1 Tax=Variovorax rhizosphaerae TaxID=1836200 RepID=A0ABU8WU68_9BURK
METNYLQTFVLVAETGSMAEAARRLNLSATSVAQQLKVLEREFGAALLARAGRTVQLTPAGYDVLARAREVLRSMQELRDVARSGAPAQIIRLGSIHTALHSIVPGLLMRLVERQPQIQVHIAQDTSTKLYDAVQQGDVDAALCVHPHFTLPKTIGWRTLRREPLVVLAPARMAKQDPHELLRRGPLIRYGRTEWGGQSAERYLRSVGISPSERVELTSLTAIAMMVDRGLGVSLIPDADPPLPAGLKVAKIALPQEFESRTLGLLWLRSSAKAGLVKLLLEAL